MLLCEGQAKTRHVCTISVVVTFQPSKLTSSVRTRYGTPTEELLNHCFHLIKKENSYRLIHEVSPFELDS